MIRDWKEGISGVRGEQVDLLTRCGCVCKDSRKEVHS